MGLSCTISKINWLQIFATPMYLMPPAEGVVVVVVRWHTCQISLRETSLPAWRTWLVRETAGSEIHLWTQKMKPGSCQCRTFGEPVFQDMLKGYPLKFGIGAQGPTKTRMMRLLGWERSLMISSSLLDTIHKCDRHTDGRTPDDSKKHYSVAW